MSIQKLKYEVDAQTQLIAIATSLKDYRVCFFINEQLHIQLQKADDIQINNQRAGIGYTFSRFVYNDTLSGIEFVLLKNKAPQGAFIKSLKKFDFLLFLKSEEGDLDIYSLSEKLKEVSHIQAVLPIVELTKTDQKKVENYL